MSFDKDEGQKKGRTRGAVSDEEKKALLSFLQEFANALSSQPGRTTLAEHRIFLKSDRTARQ